MRRATVAGAPRTKTVRQALSVKLPLVSVVAQARAKPGPSSAHVSSCRFAVVMVKPILTNAKYLVPGSVLQVRVHAPRTWSAAASRASNVPARVCVPTIPVTIAIRRRAEPTAAGFANASKRYNAKQERTSTRLPVSARASPTKIRARRLFVSWAPTA